MMFSILFNYSIDTFGVESIVITDSTRGRVCLECSFYSFSTDTGCTVELVSSGSSIVIYTETINRSGNGTAKGCMDVVDVATGQLTFHPYGQSDKLVLTLVPVEATNTVISVNSNSTAMNMTKSCIYLSEEVPLITNSGHNSIY